MRPMTVLASVFFASVVVAAVEVGCSSDDNSTTPYTPFDSGSPSVPEAGGPSPSAVAITVVGKGYIVSSDGVQVEAGASNPTGFIGVDGGPVVDCTQGSTSGCTAPQGTVLYVYASQNWTFAGWSAPASEAGGYFNTDPDLIVGAATPGAVTATFVVQNNGPDAAPPAPTPVADSGGGD
jgi:hypothetical protein